MHNTKFPIAEILPELLARLEAGSRLVLEAPPGAGKTTQVPLALLSAPWLQGRKIVMLEPRRIAARAAAEFMAAQLGESVGDTVGYRIRFEAKVSARTRVEVVTEGILTRMIQSDPELGEVGAILFDEFHERHLNGDFGAALALEIQNSLRPDLRLAIMSATLDGERIARWFDAPRLTSAGRSFPVRVGYPPAKQNEDWPFHLRRAVEQALAETEGDLLVFLPGRREIDRAQQTLATLDAANGSEIALVPLHGELSLADQHAALAPAHAGTRRIVLATNVAESSVTLPGIRAVIDTGLAREPYYDPNSGFTRLETVNISQASADQRAGRAGRVAAGVAYRLWPQSRRLEPSRRAEIAQVELSGLALELGAWGASDLRWLDAPPPGALASARGLLHLLGAATSPNADAGLTELGRAMLAGGASPRLATAVLRAAPAQRALACDALALIEARNPLRGDGARNDDFRLRHAALVAFRGAGGRGARESGADRGLLATIAQAADAWRRRFGVRDAAPAQAPGLTAIGDVLAHAFPDRIARQDPNNPRRYALSNGRGASLHQNSALYGEPWLVVVDLRMDERDSLVLAAAPFDADLLERDFADRLERKRTVRWNRETRGVEAFEEYRFAELVLERRSVPAKAEDALPALLAAVRELGLDALPWSDHARALRARAAFLREACPELELPDLSDTALIATLEDWLAPALAGKSKLDSLGAAQLGDALAARFDYTQRRALDEHAPEALRVPSGNERALHYEAGKPPVLAVKLQELFGLADTPRIGKGRIGVTLHLLSPAQRPIQVTQDLKGFWERTYPEVKKELKGRYPKHPWPDDPWTAVPTARAKPRPR
ncbi:MAG: ATP-dependent helicase HrpB [Rudaea sp.]|uniref:ATP-dependent helicase HrpB n=1 Tax=unclassified Rudaea TaxID=2627037 RepID=UPI0010F5ED95|nr:MULTISPECIES: ATP-dependent helicase HrpB [unclassified Rudaea]MBN8886083.1 ATP-dependent helicase HrpB [Rudaea sp.]